jgi:two-component system chemotaxis sensor kinase CheA
MASQEGREPGSNLRQHIEGLALRWVLAERNNDSGADAEWSRSIAAIRELADAAGNREIADMAAELLASVRPGGPGGEQSTANAIQRLQQALDGAGAPAQTASAAPVEASLGDDPELVADFVSESREHLRSIEEHLLRLDQDCADTEAIHATFRSFHTIKGLAGFLGFEAVQHVSHDVETLLDLARNGKLHITGAVIDVVLESADYLGREVANIAATLSSGSAALTPAPYEHLLAKVKRVSVEAAAGAEAPEPAEPEPAEPEPEAVETVKIEDKTETEAPAPKQAPASPAAPPAAARAGAPAAKDSAAAQSSSSIKVNTEKLDFLVDMVGEMVIAQSLVRHSPELASISSARLSSSLAQLARITDEIQKTAMSLRMVPVGQLFQKMSRLVRDLTRKSGKQAELEIFGADVELDRNIVQELADPLMHMVRNSVDHGVEPPEERRKAGKNPVARITLRARHQSGHILIEISDDGRGINRAKVLEKAVAKGLIPAGARISDAEAFDLIFAPGFSTAEKITDISGRGVGMDVVKKHIQKLRGNIETQSVMGKGTTFLLKVPLTLAIIDGLVVGLGDERYILPIFAVREILKPSEGMVSTVEGRREIAAVRGRVLPVVRLARRFAVETKGDDASVGLLIIAESRGSDFALAVDTVLGKQEVVIKSLGDAIKDVPGVAGGAILGDGRVGLILDVDGVYRGRGTAASCIDTSAVVEGNDD